MSEEFEQAHEHLEHAAHGEHGKSHTRAAIVIAVMAAALALTEFAAKDAQTSYLTNHIAASDTWAQYQAKSIRRTVLLSEAEMLQALPGATAQKQIADARSNADRMHSEPGADGMEQLSEKAHGQEHLRDHAMHRTPHAGDSQRGAADCYRAGLGFGGDRSAGFHACQHGFGNRFGYLWIDGRLQPAVAIYLESHRGTRMVGIHRV